jgi:UDP-N-acetylmuramate dehydrogenase
MLIYHNHPLKEHNTFHIPASAGKYIILQNESECRDLPLLLGGENPLILGGGSNYLFVARHIPLVLSYTASGMHVVEQDENTISIEVEAGYNWHDLVEYCTLNGYFGIENLALIPGLCGAAPVQNIGAYGTEICRVIEYVKGYDIRTGKQLVLHNHECQFEYRNSIFKQELSSNFLITSIIIRLYKKGDIIADYPDIQQYLDQYDIKEPVHADIFRAIIAIRRQKLPDPAQIGNAGSFFKNPIITQDQLNSVQAVFPQIPFYAQSEQRYKIPAAYLIDKCGWKGYRNADAGVHPKQALVLVNYADAMGNQIYELAQEIQQSVLQRTGIMLETEVNIIQ